MMPKVQQKRRTLMGALRYATQMEIGKKLVQVITYFLSLICTKKYFE